MTDHVFFNLLNYFELTKRDEMQDLSSSLSNVF